MKTIKNKQGISLVEAMVATIVAALITLVGATLPAAFKGGMMQAEDRFYAIDLCISQIEDLKDIAEGSWSDSDLGDGNHPTHTLTDSSGNPLVLPPGFGISYDIANSSWSEDGPGDVDYKDVTVTCVYNTNSVQLRTYITE